MSGRPAGRRVLVVTSSYVPACIADMHRARHLAWELPTQGWAVEVLYPNSDFQRPECLEPGSSFLFNEETPRHAVAPASARFFRLLKMRSIGWRALWPLDRAGARLLRSKKFDLVYITTANFPLFCLGRRWARLFDVPYVLDYHDPWVRDHEQYRTTTHSLKLRIARFLSRSMERYALEGAAGVVSVSPAYLDELRARYGPLRCLDTYRSEAIPFAGSEHDVNLGAAPVEPLRQHREIVYVGAGGSIMAKSFSAICEALAEVRRRAPELVAFLKVRILGTHSHWRTGGPKPLEEIADRLGLADVVEEHPPRITYARALELAQQSDGLLVLGVDDAGYFPSKLFTYALSGKPLLACLRADSAARVLFDRMPNLGHLMPFEEGASDPLGDNLAAMTAFLTQVRRRDHFDRRSDIDEYLAPAMARKHAVLFERICAEKTAA